MKSNFQCEWHIMSEPLRVPPVVREVLTCLDERMPGISQEERHDIRLIFHELIYNAILHGNHSDHLKQVHIRLALGSRFVVGTILDEGEGFNCRNLIGMAREAYDDFQNESGRGLKLVLALADEVVYGCSGRQVTFVKRIGTK